jgi:TonB-linked SusC/RagA family outer membrane protein
MRNHVKRSLALVAALAGLAPAALHAQQGTGSTITGVVTTEAGAPLQGVSVSIATLSVGGYTDAEGHYSFATPAARSGDTVTVTARRIGYQPRTATVKLAGDKITQDFKLAPTAAQIEGVVVTALGLEREKRSLGVAAQSVSGDELSTTKTPNLVNALSGKVAGVKVIGSSNFGGSARLVIRGEGSIGGNNQPLFVVDGVPVDNSAYTNANQSRGYGGFDYGNAIQDLNTDDIESVSVLKGPAAAALYGSRAANGAIVITTKSGKSANKGARGFSMSASSNVTLDQIAKLPDYQNEYGQGARGQFEWSDGLGGGVNDGEDASWGPKLNPDSMKVQWFSNGQPAPWVAHPNNVRDFFQTGRTMANTFSASGSADRASFRLSLGTQDQKGIVPTSALQRITSSATGSAMLGTKVNASANVQYIHNRGNNRPGTGYDEFNPMMGFVWFGRQVDTKQLKDMVQDADGNQISWNYNYHNNPYWNLSQNNNRDERNRVIGSAQLQYRPVSWLTGMVRSGTDFYRNNRHFDVARGWIGGFFDPFTSGDFTSGGFSDENIFSTENNTDFLVTAVTSPLEKLGVTLNVGGNRRVRAMNRDWIGTDALVLPGVYNPANSAVKYTPYQYQEKKLINSLYGQAQFAYNDYFFVDVTGRNDWSSTLPKGNNSYFYPSVSSSLVFTDLAPWTTMGGKLGYGKLRAAWSRVGSDADPYLLAVTYAANPAFGDTPRFFVPQTVTNPNLKPETTDSWEAGTELSFLDGRAGVDFTYYQKATTNQILTASVSPASGFTAAAVNAGKLSNKGVEVQMNLVPVRLKNSLTWDVVANYARNRNHLDALYGDLKTYQLGSRFFNTSVEARLGQPYGAIVGYKSKRNEQGNLVLNAKNLPQKEATTSIIGNVSPDWTGGVTNTLRYKDFDLSALVDARIGGKLWSATNRFGTYAGILKSTLVGRDTGIVMHGVDATGAAVTARVSAEDYFKAIDGIEENFVYDASYVKLREVRLGWNVPQALTQRLNNYRMNVALVGRNLLTHSKAPNIDPEAAFSAGNSQGIEFGQLPATRSIGFQVNVTP